MAAGRSNWERSKLVECSKNMVNGRIDGTVETKRPGSRFHCDARRLDRRRLECQFPERNFLRREAYFIKECKAKDQKITRLREERMTR
jgi:hypothetical protein